MTGPIPSDPAGPDAVPTGTVGAGPLSPAFAHASEAELSRILDFYAVRWEYEPHVFPILWNTDGDVLESFAPDFYLPDLDLYIELTTLRQKLVRRKNRKLRRLRELYPGVRVKLLYARDFRALMLKYGRIALADELSGTPGQVTPDRSYDLMLAGPFGQADASWAGGSGAPGVGAKTSDPARPVELPSAEPSAVRADPVASAPVASHRRRRRRSGRRSMAASPLEASADATVSER